MEGELAHLEAEQQADPHARFRYWHDLTRCWRCQTVRTRYRRATVENPHGHRSSWAKVRPVESILNQVCSEMGEDFTTFTRRVCQAIHERPHRINVLQRGISDLRRRLAEGRRLPKIQ